MELYQLEYFRTIAKTENFRQAANQLSISQPALSRAVLKLEEELGVALFDRIKRKVKLNANGKLFQKRVESCLLELETGIREIEQIKSPYTGTVSIAFIQALGIAFMPRVLNGFREAFPNIELKLYQDKILESIEKTKNREADFCFISSEEAPNHLRWKPLTDEELFLYVSIDHRLASRSSIKLNEAADEAFIGYKPNLSMSSVMLKFCRDAGFVPTIKFEGEDILTIAGFVSSGLGVAIIPELHGIHEKYIKKIKISEPYCHRKIGFAWLQDEYLSPSAKCFKDYMMKRTIESAVD